MRTALLLSFLIAAPPSLLSPSASPAAAGASVRPALSSSAPTASVAADAQVPPKEQAAADAKPGADEKAKKPALSLRASPPISFSPANIQLIAELRGGPDDYEEFYCPSVEWDWGDGTRSEASADCDPYEAGVSQITRRFSKQHVYNLQGRYRVQIRLKRNTKVLTSASVNVQVRAGLREPGAGVPY